MTYVAIISHTPEQCPGASRENMDRTSTAMAQMESIGKELGVTMTALHVLLPGHTGVVILEAPDYETASRFIMRVGIDRWNDVVLYQSLTPEEAMKISAERIASSG